ncbi:cyclase family protein [Actinoplanes bogorensis]|uniref:Cyclase family protein n=1 Tax=Paractinoplanes bogorensis TaxID=1610840 RepID=A0ABS5YVR6_9ACTN|nr:cyclase family protein [Actinoplanes bogorensis]MBU2667528.1 cyclase family protein [Actinoplanes bogorensis]
MEQYRAELTADITFTTGGRLQAQGLRVAVPHLDVTEADLARILVGSLGLRDVERVELRDIRTFAEPASFGPPAPPRRRFVELSHVITDGMVTYPGLAAPVITAHLTWEDSRPQYAPGTEFSLDRIEMLGQTGTYLDTPRHRYVGGTDLAGVSLERLADLPAVVVRTAGSGRRAVTEADLEPLAVAGHAVLLHTGGDRGWGTPEYGADAPYLTGEAAALLVERGAALVGIDSVNIDDNTVAAGGERPAHTVLLAAGIPIVEHLTGLEELPPHGARFTAAPPRIVAFGTFPVRAYAQVPYYEPHDHTRSAGWQPAG